MIKLEFIELNDVVRVTLNEWIQGRKERCLYNILKLNSWYLFFGKTRDNREKKWSSTHSGTIGNLCKSNVYKNRFSFAKRVKEMETETDYECVSKREKKDKLIVV